MQLIAAQIRQTESFDVEVQIGDDVFKCFMLVLQSYSKFFHKRSSHEKIIKISSLHITPIVFHKIYEWMLKSTKVIERNCLIPMLMGAKYLKVEMLEQQIWNLIQDGERFQECEAFLLYLEAKQWNFEKVKAMMMHRVQQFFMTVVCTQEFLHMEQDEIQNWFKLDSIGISSEVDVFYSAARWLLYDWGDRQKYLMDVMQHVRFGLLEAWRIVEFRMNKNMDKLQPILDNAEFQKMLESSLSYSIYHNSFKDDSSEQFTDFLIRFGFKRLRQREVFYETCLAKDSAYTYGQFENYLKDLALSAFTYWKKNFK